MHLEPHDNLAVLSIRHDLYGPGRFQSGSHHPEPVAHTHHAPPTDLSQKRDGIRVVDQPQRPEACDCRPTQCGGHTGTDAYHPYGAYRLPPVSEPDIVTVPADIAPPSEPGALQGYIYGQAVPVNGNLLDILA